ncbi:hypothetical protein IEQ34_026930 [Dendrobium chrysotoxum]|uniref:RRM domain-containing protein n=1 Tax=Dendrobium chrysotoxum TaxID=161865 RepID=A0AAV7FKP8_DENCH|nr:hypothetical protein IEQ34_026930 [Dendrobium chrysotoxum]
MRVPWADLRHRPVCFLKEPSEIFTAIPVVPRKNPRWFRSFESDLQMGKKSKEMSEDKEEAVKSLFGADNPFRRKRQPDAVDFDAGDIIRYVRKLGLGMDSSVAEKETMKEAKSLDSEHSNARKRKRETGIIAAVPSPPSSDEESIARKRMKLVKDAEVDGSNKKKNKRKRDEVELEYEKRKLGSVGEDEPAATVVAVGEKRKADAAAADMLVTKESFDDESKLLRTVFIGNLPLKTKSKALKREFARFGEIESVRIRSVPLVDTKAPRKAAVIKGQINEVVDSMNAYIVFKEEQSAHAALSNNMAQIGGNHIRVDMACPPRKKMKGDARLYDRKRTAFVGNLPFDVKDEELYQLFCGLSQSEPNVEAVRVVRDPNTSIGKGIAYVLFKTRDAVNNVCKRRDLKIRDRNLRVCHAKSDALPSKVKEGPSKRFPHQRQPTAYSGIPSGRGEKRKRIDTDSVSYEGTRSSKTGVPKKSSFRPPQSSVSNSGSRRSGWNEQQGRKTKRPAVAARKAKEHQKRKQSSGTSENANRNKRARRQ